MTSRISDAGATATMLYGSENGGATAGHGYRPVPGSLSFAPGETGRTIRVATIDGVVTGATVRVDAARDGLLAGAAFAHNRGERGVRLIGDRQPEPGPRLAVWSVLASAAAG